MKFRPLGKSGIEGSVVALGTWAIGGWMWGGTEEKQAIRAIHAALDAGVNFLDTAPIYGFGRSEEIVGKAIRDRRSKVVLATKCGLVWGRDEDKGDLGFHSNESEITNQGKIVVRKYLAPDSIRVEVEESLRRLKIDTIDLYQTHWQESTTPIEETMAALTQLKKEGKIRAIGVCNANDSQMDQYRAAGDLAADQEKYSMLDRRAESNQLPYVQKHVLAFLAYSPLELGLLTGKVPPDRTFEEGDLRKNHFLFSPEARKRVLAMFDSFKPIAERYGCSFAQLTIAWTLAQPGCSHLLVGARTPDHAVANAKAADIHLSAEDIKTIDQGARNLV